jgi:hypothetical protein
VVLRDRVEVVDHLKARNARQVVDCADVGEHVERERAVVAQEAHHLEQVELAHHRGRVAEPRVRGEDRIAVRVEQAAQDLRPVVLH